jgi:anthranilate synthase component I
MALSLKPSYEEFLKLTERGNLIPIRDELLADTETPLTAYQKLTRHDPTNSFILESVEGGEHLGRYSFIGLQPRTILTEKNGKLILAGPGQGDQKVERALKGDPLEAVAEQLKPYRPVPVDGLPRFTGGMVGFLGWEYVTHVEPVPRGRKTGLDLPLLHFLLVDTLVIFDRVRQVIQIVANAHVQGDPKQAYEEARTRIQKIKQLLECPAALPNYELPEVLPEAEFECDISKSEYIEMVSRGKQYIKQGDIFQFVPSQRFSMRTGADPLAIYRALRMINPSPYMFLMNLGDFSLVGSSPEIHVRCEEGLAEIRPIAGTRPRGKTEAEDQTLAKELLADEKERAEHLMLVDLARNDLGRVSKYESVTVPRFMTVEQYSHVMHIVSQVTGRVKEGQTAFDLMRATFPAGTLSGAPKIRAMQIISELEKKERGAYGGALGYFAFNGNLDTCIIIRTLVLKGGRAYVQAGAGVVDDSIPEKEYEETVNKARALVKAVALAEYFGKSGGKAAGEMQP